MAKHKRDQDELEAELREQAEALRASAEAYDSGKLWEAKRLATTAYILVHDGGRNSRSLLGQLGLKGPMVSTANHDPSAMLPLANVNIDVFNGGAGMTFVPVLDSFVTSTLLPFSRWYEEPVFVNGRLSLSRKNLVFTLRSQAGGAHVDESITDDAFQWLRKNGPIHVKTDATAPAKNSKGEEVGMPAELQNLFAEYDGPVPNGHYASMRQIAWEIDQALQQAGF